MILTSSRQGRWEDARDGVDMHFCRQRLLLLCSRASTARCTKTYFSPMITNVIETCFLCLERSDRSPQQPLNSASSIPRCDEVKHIVRQALHQCAGKKGLILVSRIGDCVIQKFRIHVSPLGSLNALDLITRRVTQPKFSLRSFRFRIPSKSHQPGASEGCGTPHKKRTHTFPSGRNSFLPSRFRSRAPANCLRRDP